jgi:hypothetical protein
MEFAVRRIFPELLAFLAASSTAHAQDCGAPPPNGPPLLHPSETATITISPTLLVVDSLADSQSPSAVVRERCVNSPGPMRQVQMAAAMAPPLASADYQDISVTFSADVILAGKPQARKESP